MDKRQIVSLKEVVLSANTGADAIQRAPIVHYDTGIKCIRIQDISQNKNYKDWGFCEIKDSDYSKFSLKSKDILIARTGETIGANKYIHQNLKAVFNNGLIRLKVVEDLCFPKYLYYVLQDQYFVGFVDGYFRSTSTQPNMKIGDLLRFKIHLPSLLIQYRIASILSAYDDLIENNLRRIKILEEMAQIIYREWFIKFRFHGHQKVKLVDSSLGKIPEGWEICALSELVDFVKGVEPGSKNYHSSYEDGMLPLLRVGDLGKRESVIFVNRELVKDSILRPEDIAITMDGTVGLVRIGLEGAYSSGIRRVVFKDPKRIGWAFVYQLLQSDSIQAIIHAHAKGTTIKHAGSSIGYMIFALPKFNLMEEFEKHAVPLLKQTLCLVQRNKVLERSRDLLLPKLITGELDVSELDITIPEANA